MAWSYAALALAALLCSVACAGEQCKAGGRCEEDEAALLQHAASHSARAAGEASRGRLTHLSGRETVRASFECFTTANHPKLTVVSVVAGLPEEYVSLMRENRALEADRYSYESCEVWHSLDPSRAMVWSKIKVIQELLALGKQRIVWMDADAYVVKEKPFESIVEEHFDKGKDIVFTDDLPESTSPVNLGVIAMRNSNWTQQFWQSVYDDYPSTWARGFMEQQAVADYRSTHRADFDAHAVIIPRQIMNNIGSPSGDFIAHAAGGEWANLHNKYPNLVPHLAEVNNNLREQADPSGPFLTQRTSRWTVSGWIACEGCHDATSLS